jgi:tripartite-type tricarboxylate transporter receptor subunit TctC
MQLSRAFDCVIVGFLLNAGVLLAQTYPNKSIRIVTSEPGGGLDLSARLIGQGLSANMGQPVVVDNRPSGVIPGEIISKAQPDGYSLLITGSAFWLLPLMQDTPYDPIKDFAPITLAIRSPTILVVHPSVPVKSVSELITMAKAKPGSLNYASSAPGGSSHLAGELFKAMAGVEIVRIAYKGNGPAVNDLLAGQVQMMFSNAGGATQHVKSGRLRALAVTSARPSELLPGLPTVAASLPGYVAETVYGVFAPARTPTTITQRLNDEIVALLKKAEFKDKFFNAGVETVGTTRQQLADAMRHEIASMGKVIREVGIRSQ